MASLLNPYLSFTDDARAAMEFYRDVFGGDLSLRTFGDFGGPESHHDLVMHAELTTPSGFTLMASDSAPGVERTVGDNVALSLSGDDAEELRGYWDQLSASGTTTLPLEKQMWGDEFGMCVDRFGIHWYVDIAAGGDN
ncbi:MAG TPA: VOC family protein [Marmoricola sp.]|nr:VOC family protein [Marmoricola sp.]